MCICTYSHDHCIILPLQEKERVERESVVRQKVAASTFARGYLSGIVTTVFGKLQTSGFFYDPVLREVCGAVYV